MSLLVETKEMANSLKVVKFTWMEWKNIGKEPHLR